MKQILVFSIALLTLFACSSNKGISNSETKNKDELTSSHVFIASYEGTEFEKCMGKTMACPKECNGSGNLAKFGVVSYEKLSGEVKKEELKSYQMRTSDYYKNNLDNTFAGLINALKKGDWVRIKINFSKGTIPSEPKVIETIISMEKIS